MEPDRNPLVEIKSAGKVYRKGKLQVPVFDALSLTVHEGEFLVIMGPSGSGKTTLLNFLAGFDTPTTGSVVIDGKNLARMTDGELADWRVRNVGFVFQLFNLIPVLTALENVELPLIRLGLSRPDRKARSSYALQLVGLAGRERHFPAELSGGEEQRVAIARAIVTDSRFIIADEPTGNLDRTSANEILSLMKQLHVSLKKTIVMVTHDREAAAYGERIVFLDKGKIVEYDAAALHGPPT